MANLLSRLDGQQVLRSAYDDSKNRIRVDAEIDTTVGDVEVAIVHTEDSIRLGDGTSFFTSTTVGADIGLDVNLINTDLDIRDLSHSQDSVRLGDGTNLTSVNGSGELQVRDDDLNTTLSSLNTKLVDGTDIGDVTVNNAAGASAVNIQDGGNSITVDAVDLDIRDLSSAQDSVEVLQNTHDDLNTNANLQINDADVSSSNEVDVRDVANNSYVTGSISVGTSEIEAKVGGSRLSERKAVRIFNNTSTIVYFGPTGLTSSIGEPIRRRQSVTVSAGPDLGVFLITASGTAGDIRIQEIA